MFDERLAQRAAETLTNVRQAKPLVHSITNLVTMNYTANVLLACGAAAIMAHGDEEVEEVVDLCDALVLNLGTLTQDRVGTMLKAGKRAGLRGIPIVLDPVGSGATTLRTGAAQQLLGELAVRVIRGNPSEILSLGRQRSQSKGVESMHLVGEALDVGMSIAKAHSLTVAVTGKIDVVTDGSTIYRVHNGHAMMAYVTGAGCAATSLIAAFLSVDTDPLGAAATALAYFGLAGEKAGGGGDGPGSFQIKLLDALYSTNGEDLKRHARVETGAPAKT